MAVPSRPSTVCIVTGASRGIGRGIALVLARDKGCAVYATARSEASLQDLAAQVDRETKLGGRIVPCAVDHTDDLSVKTFVERVLRESGGVVDLLVNNAYGGVSAIGNNFGSMFWEKPLSVWDASHQVGLRSHYIMCALVAPTMVRRQRGLIVNISSQGGQTYLFDVAYGVGKAALDRMGADMAAELASSKVNVITLWPGAVNTETTTFPEAESVEFSGRIIGALLDQAAPAELAQLSGKVVMTVELATRFGVVDVDGRVPRGETAAARRAALSSLVPVQWRLDAKLEQPAHTNSSKYKSAFNGSGSKL